MTPEFRRACEVYEDTPIGGMGVLAYNGRDKDDLKSLQPEFEQLEQLAAIGKIEIDYRRIEDWTANSFTSLITFRRLA